MNNVVSLNAAPDNWKMVYFTAKWSDVCEAVTPVIEKLAIEYADQYSLQVIDVDRDPEFASKSLIKEVPTMVLYHGESPVNGFSGEKCEREIRDLLSEYFYPQWYVAADKAHKSGEYDEALPIVEDAYLNIKNDTMIPLAYAYLLICVNRLEEGFQVLNKVDIRNRDEHYRELAVELDRRKKALVTPAMRKLIGMGKRTIRLAKLYADVGLTREALEILIDIDPKRTKEMLDTMDKKTPLVIEYQRKVYAKLY